MSNLSEDGIVTTTRIRMNLEFAHLPLIWIEQVKPDGAVIPVDLVTLNEPSQRTNRAAPSRRDTATA